MALFDFMTDEDFRASLEADYHELDLCMKAGAWKAVHVLAGSIIETILLDYLLAIDYAKQTSTKLLELRLYDIINICKTERILSNKSADLSHIIREYRNLIHPEKMRRIQGTADENGAVVAQALVKMVVEDVAARRREIHGNTAEQLVTKIMRDPSVTSILGHLLKNTKEFEMKRLLLKVLPDRYFYIVDPDNWPDGAVPSKTTLSNLEACYRLAFDAVSEETKKEVAKQFVRILQEESADVVACYETAFFRGKDLAYYSAEDAQLVKHHFFSRIKEGMTSSLLRAMEGIGKYLTPEEIDELFVDPFVQSMISTEVDISADKAKDVFLAEFHKMDSTAEDKVAKRLKDWIGFLEQKAESDVEAEMIKDLLTSVDSFIFFWENG